MALASNPGAVSIVPQLSVRRGRAAVEFYRTAFGAIEIYCVGGTDDNLRAQNVDLDTGVVQGSGSQLNPTHLAGSVLSLTLGNSFMQYRSYLPAIGALTRLKG